MNVKTIIIWSINCIKLTLDFHEEILKRSAWKSSDYQVENTTDKP